MSGAMESSNSHLPYSPSHASFSSDPPPVNDNPNVSYPPLLRSYASYLPRIDEPDSPYSPPNAHTLPIVQEDVEPLVEDDDSHVPYYPVSPPGLIDEPLARGSESHLPYSPPHVPVSMTPQGHNEVAFSPYSPIHTQTGEFLLGDDGFPSLRELLRRQESPFQRLLESSEPNHRWHRRLRSSLPYGGGRSLPTTEQVLHDIMSSETSVETTGKRKVCVEGIAEKSLEEEMEEKSRNAADFECNVCLDVAKEPVVTSCGHLFCWPCLYQWLHLHCGHKECPVCKGEVIESRLTPIYGRGSSETSVEKRCAASVTGLKIPPRPRGHRFEGSRQQLQRPSLRRLREGIASRWRHVIDEEMRNAGRLEEHGDRSQLGILDGVHHRILTTLRAWRMQREEGNPESGSNIGDVGFAGNSLSNAQSSSTSSLFQDGIDLWHRFSGHGLASTDRLAAITADLGRAVGRFASSSNHSGASASAFAVNPQNPEPLISRPPMGPTLFADQGAASSTNTVIQGDTLATDALTEPNSGGSSRLNRRRGWCSMSGSLDVDGALPARKRRL